MPKNDRCDRCELAFCKSDKPSESETEARAAHIRRKDETKNARDADRNASEEHRAVLCFDLQNVIALPRANVSNFHYKRKLNVYNLTGHLTTNNSREAYCTVRNEGQSRRAGSDIASSLQRMLEEAVKQHPEIKHFTLWSDSCVPQNKNSIMSTAIMRFLFNHSTVQSITQKFGEPGHSYIKEVDNVYSQIERRRKSTEIYSPVGLLKALNR
jgi:hypothetical protein